MARSLRTNKRTLTPEGSRRKLHRSICSLLEQKHPRIYAALAAEAQQAIRADNEDIFSAIIDSGLAVVHNPSPELLAEKARILALQAAALEDKQ